LQKDFGFSFDTLGWSEVVVARLLADGLLPESVEKILYLDGDTIAVGSLKELWETDLEGQVLGMVAEPTANHKRKKELGLEGRPYYNSGMMLIDLKRWREEKAGEKILKFYESRGGNLFAPDQDAISGAMADEILELMPKYNWFNIFWQYPYKALVKISRPAAWIGEEAYRDSAKDPRIIHFLGEDRPWRQGNTHRYTAEYNRYLGMTPWSGTETEKGWEVYFKLYGLFWKILKPFPILQYRIIDGLIPAMMKMRKKKRTKAEAATGKEGKA
jgi:lipopolysaccharide biosynthesis glycosyltransferase